MKFEVIADPGHSWCKVPKALLVELGIADKISAFSYQRGEFAYLEEDRDLWFFIGAMKAAGKPVGFRERYSNGMSRVRGYRAYLVPAK